LESTNPFWIENDQGKRLFELFPKNFFDIVIIDEAHRSGFDTWQEILKHFGDAIHLGMTATPKKPQIMWIPMTISVKMNPKYSLMLKIHERLSPTSSL
jgi:hypothetical protein